MFRNVFLKTLFNLRWQLLGWVLAVLFVAFITMSLFNSFNQNGIDQIVNSVPDSLKSLVGSVDDYKTIPGYIGQQIFGPNVVILTIIMAVMLFANVSANEEDRGGMQTLLSLPVSRTSVYFQKLFAVMLVISLVCASIILGTWLGLLVVDKSADYGRILQSTGAAILMNTAYGMVAYAVAMGTGKKALTIAVSSGYAFVSFVISSLAPAVKDLDVVDRFSIFHYYNNPQIMNHGLDAHSVIVLSSVIVSLVLLGWIGFVRRDIQTS